MNTNERTLNMFLAVFVILVSSGLAQSGDLDFDIYDYSGDISQSILRLYYKKTNIWKRQPKACYGVLVDWRIALFPCSCMSHSKSDKQTNTAWRHMPPVTAQMIDVSTLEVGTMFEEYQARYGNHKVKIVKYAQGPVGSDAFSCKSDLLYEWTAVELERRINFSRLIWFPTENMTVMRNLTEEMISQFESGEHCRVVYWEKDIIKDNKTGKTLKEHYVRLTRPVHFSPWDTSCNYTVCPSFEMLQNYKVNVTNNKWDEKIPTDKSGMKQDRKICLNEEEPKKRTCVGWTDGPTAICALVPGTPVVCNSDRFSGGIIGTITNTTLFCPTEDGGAEIAPVNLVAEAFPLVYRHLRIVNAPGYAGFFTRPPKGPFKLWIQKSLANNFHPFPAPVIFTLSCIISIPFKFVF